ncbi:MAG TPA: ATP-binding protein [Bryobacteraceae bacterium]|jgi:PAS domain S-box-containing protein
MRPFRDIPIRQKLMLIVMVTTGAAMLFAATGVVALDSFLFRNSLRRDLSSLAQIIADNSTAAAAFSDERSAAETLNALRARPHVASACIYLVDGTMLAGYSRAGETDTCPAARGSNELRFGSSGVTVSQAIVLSGRRVGTLMLFYDLGEITERIEVFGAIVLGVLLMSSVIAFLLSSRLRSIIATSISQLVSASRSVSETNDYSIRARKVSNDELGVLADRFNEMLAGIQSRDDTLRAALRDREEALHDAETARERFRFMAESMPQKIFTATPRGDVDYFNQQWTEFTGLAFKAIQNWGWTQFVHPGDLKANLDQWRHSLETGEPLLFQRRLCRADGEYRWHLSRVHPMRDEQGAISMWIGSDTDIHEQKEKEQELRLANEDLQQFAYSASHDLQEPVRNVTIYSEVISRRYQRVLDAEGLQFLGFLTEGGRRLATLINDLLAYTRAGVLESETAPVNSSLVLEMTLSSLAEAIRESGASLTYDSLPEIAMSEAHLQQVFQNLIGNALKYRREERPQIHISAVREDGGWRFSVRDNGIGINPLYKEKIFGVFKRLHRNDKYSGTGIGLAICQRVVERYGGRIWVESEPRRGATFYFTVPETTPRIPSRPVDSAAGGGQSS